MALDELEAQALWKAIESHKAMIDALNTEIEVLKRRMSKR